MFGVISKLSRRGAHGALPGLLAMVLAALACNVPQGSSGDNQSTLEAVYNTITAQANMSPAPTSTATEVASGTPTASATASVTPTPPESRSGNGQNLSVRRCTATISVDAVDDDWKKLEGVLSFVLGSNTYGEAEWLGTDDLSGSARLCWIDSTLYLFAEVKDDVHVQTQQGRYSWKGDEVELLFDAELRDDYYEEVWNGDDTQLGLSPGDFGEIQAGVTQYHPTTEDRVNVEIAARRAIEAGGRYVIEAAIPWSILRVTPTDNANYGFCLAISDNDHAGTAQQDSMVSHCTGLLVREPTTWVTLTLVR